MNIKDKRVADLTGHDLRALVEEIGGQEHCYVALRLQAARPAGGLSELDLALWVESLKENIFMEADDTWSDMLEVLAARRAEIASISISSKVAEARRLLEGTGHKVVKDETPA